MPVQHISQTDKLLHGISQIKDTSLPTNEASLSTFHLFSKAKTNSMPFKILIVDDQPDNLKVLIEMITAIDPNLELLRTTNPLQAFPICKSEVPGIVITDWEMPELNGLQLIEQLKSDPVTENIQIIMCTGIMTRSKNLRMALETGAIDYIRKPVDPIELEARLNSIIRLCASQQQVREQVRLLEQQKEEIALQKKKREEFLIHELTLKEKDVGELATMLSMKQNMAASVAEKLKQISRVRSVEDPALKELMMMLNVQLQDQKMEQLLNERIEDVNAAFYERLSQRFPDLTKGERELCVLIRAGSSSKQIAEFKHISPESVSKNRHRLRKKLKIGADVDLDNLLRSL